MKSITRKDFPLCREAQLLAVLVIFMCSHVIVEGRIYNDPPYDYSYLEDDCKPFTGNGSYWDDRVQDLSAPGTRLYGYVEPVKDHNYEGPMNCAIKIQAPPNYHLVVRVPIVEIYHEHTGCIYDFMTIIGATKAESYCGFGTIPYAFFSIENWLIISFNVSEWNKNHGYVGFVAYYTAVHPGPCDIYNNGSEWRCQTGYCTPSEVVCDTKDNCGNWEEEVTGVCGLTTGAIAAIAVTCSIVGGALIFFLVYCLYAKKRDNRRRETRQSAVNPVAFPTMAVGYDNNGAIGNVTMMPATNTGPNGRLVEPPPPYTTGAYIDDGVFLPQLGLDNTTMANQDHNNGMPVPMMPPNANPAMGMPPPLYTSGAAGGDFQADTTGGASYAGAMAGNTGVSYDNIPHKGN